LLHSSSASSSERETYSTRLGGRIRACSRYMTTWSV
jgi:hypothetical protein